ncbi:zinc finger protein 271-like isoform X1 [Bufo gargarizans]|uniref:zinc finger protein 271-like isoform X1 n=1 Tax=Bufo gargarizans TaxID=30331 RepID=UPI001CF14D4E|nr:zinc finger protein 271-like isoform X1 [Bufo gargarizans]XP_044130377.1 zinc finger protein 271-like isoform X1 [Bufo gargarizans]
MDQDKVDVVEEQEEKPGKCENVADARKQPIKNRKKKYSAHKICHCMDCGKSFTRKSSLIVHQRIHTGEKLFVCLECGKRFSLKSSMVRHMRTHTPKTLKICPDCGKCFSRYSSLSQHQKVHRKERLYRCPYCEKSFTWASQLVVHQKIHKRKAQPGRSGCEENGSDLDRLSTQESTRCLECGRYFKEHRSLMRHQRIHKESTLIVPRNRIDRLAHDIPFHGSADCTVPPSLQMVNSLDQMKDGSFYARKTHKVGKRVQCMDCGKSFTRKSSLIVHQRIHTGEKLFMCSECGKRFGLKSSMVRHMRTHAPKKKLFQQQKVRKRRKPYKCPQCEKSFCRASQLVTHERNHRAEIVCPKSEPEDSDFLNKENDHAKMKSPGESHVCLECGKHFRRQTAFIRHQRTHKGNLLSTQNDISCSDGESGTQRIASEPVYKEEQTDVPETSHSDVDNYIVIKLGDNTYWKPSSEAKSISCLDCGKCFTRKSSLIVHQRIHTGEKLFMCSDCGKRFSLKSSLVRHMRTHSPKVLNICSDCGKCFSRYSSLFQHQKVHRKEKPFKCLQCEKSFSRASQLMFHQRTHNSEKSYPGSESGQDQVNHYNSCAEEPHAQKSGKCFTEQHLLIRHQKVHIDNSEFLYHTDLKPDADSNVPHLETESNCELEMNLKILKTQDDVCNTVSTESEKVVKRECLIDRSICKPRLSSSIRAYHCLQCGKNFTRKSSLIVHQRIHTGEKLFMCTECGKRFGFKSSLVRHLRIHTGQMLNICSECDIYFSRYGDLLLHLETHMGPSHFTRNALSEIEARDEQCLPNMQQSVNAHKGGVPVPLMKAEESDLQQKDQQPCGSGYLLPIASSVNDYLDPHCDERIQEGSLNIKQETSDHLSADAEPTDGQKNELVGTPPCTLYWGNEHNISESSIEGCSGKTDETRNHSGQPTLNVLNNNSLGGAIRDGSDQIQRRTRSGVKPFLCTECGKEFTRKSSLIVHQRIHTGEKLFMCTECGKRFGLKSSMVRHMRTHNTNFKCTACEKNFRNYSKFLEHQTCHSGEPRYAEP